MSTTLLCPVLVAEDCAVLLAAVSATAGLLEVTTDTAVVEGSPLPSSLPPWLVPTPVPV